MKNLIFVFFGLLMSSCVSYIDTSNNIVNNGSLIFDYGSNENNFKYISKVNASADNEIYFPSHFEITLPKNIINWRVKSNSFFFEYDNKQIIYIYVPYKNEGKESDRWELKNVDYHDALNISEYWEERKYNENYLYKEHQGRISKLYTNGKYKILLYNIKVEKLAVFTQSAKTFNIR